MSEPVQSALQRATMILSAAGIEDSERDARLLLAHILGIDQAQLSTRLNEILPPSALLSLDQAVAARSLHQPISHILGKRSFWNHEFLVTGDVLDPRPDTETLVEAALSQPFETVLDLGTGSGAIILSLLAERPESTGAASDISTKVLDVARRNAVRLGVGERVQFIEADWFCGLSGCFDLIVCNPPYIAEAEMADLAPEVRDWEPHLALTPGGDGLLAYRMLASGLRNFLSPDGRAYFEIGYRQAADVHEIFTNHGFNQPKVLQDMSGHDRVIEIGVK